MLRSGEEGLDGLCERIEHWAHQSLEALPEVPAGATQAELKSKRASTALCGLSEASARPDDAVGTALWIQAGETDAAAAALL